MLRTLRLYNFRKVVNDTMHFTPGINAIRAANEASKSSRLEAIAYACFGAKALKESLADVVTYDVPVSKLRVELDFDVAGVSYTVTRSKSGAELTGPGVTVTGQDEVTGFIEKLFGTSRAMAAKLMLAKQKSLAESLTEGSTEAGKMIENLADLSLIDELIQAIGEHLPAGSTAGQLALVENLRAQAAEVELTDLAPLAVAISKEADSLSAARAAAKKVADELAELELPECRQIVADGKRLTQKIADMTATLTKIDTERLKELPKAPTDDEIARARKAVEAEKQILAARKVHAELVAACVEEMWDKDLASLGTEIDEVQSTVDVAAAEARSLQRKIAETVQARAELVSTYNVARTKLEGQLIKETSCAFCDKDLTDVPEVVRRNSRLDDELHKLEANYQSASGVLAVQLSGQQAELASVEKAQATSQSYLDDLQAVVKRNNVVELLYARANEFISVSRTGVPGTWTWTGPSVDDGPRVDHAAALRALEKRRDEALQAAATREALEKQRHDLGDDREVAESQLADLELVEANRQLALEAELRPKVDAAMAAVWAAETAHTATTHAFELAKQEREQKIADMEKARLNLEAAETSLAEMEANNALVKKLRGARPAITDKLWTIVLAAVSGYTAGVRGEQSHITRADGKFKINGRPAAGLSGSAEDALGLSIRFSLTKTFLPNVDFVILDEVAAACDDQRELAMLGLLATSGFAQTILVTHSQHADAFAQNIITF